ncbi:hypothetical protein BCR32DRAFT_324112 [Anaeromyces robustus]|jgi:hypothetical protein|uniref:Uncharacterized protein n=1 Tax=Anaeromyces robustus TaxID=1754192 RepID=A0A1Y1XQN8_9FUNG|nr:hypothetical protein BCR32DRAFT_324112 [Anaeromyces robustus]|eukprot:ORX88089.1 hypothetical protein BCR32DRAFT_324112 [Anaeromyces robustus]
MLNYTPKKYILNYILLLSLKYINNVKAENQCTSNLDCAKFNTETDTHVCIRWDGQTDFVCYLSTEAYCDTDATCQSYDESLKFCYVPPWISNKNSQKQCFTVHQENGTCLEDSHCAKGLVCNNNICVSGTSNNKTGVTGAAGDTTENVDTNKNTTNNKTPVENSKNKTNSTDTSKSNNSNSKTTYLDIDEEEKKDEPIEIIGLPLWAFIAIVTVPIIFGIVILWGLSIGRKSYADEEEKKRNRIVIKNNEKDLEMNYKSSSSEKLLPQSSSDLSIKEDMMKSYLNTSSKGVGISSSDSSNSTVTNNNLSASGGLVERNLNTKSSQSTIEAKKLRKNKKSNPNLAASAGVPAKPKKPKSVVNSEFSDTNSTKGLLNSVNLSAADSGVYSSYFGGGGAASTVSSSYFNQPLTVPTDPMNNYYYQQMLAAQQQQQLQAQTLMNQYYIDGAMGMPTVDMMQYQQQLYGNMAMNNQMLYSQGTDLNSTAAATTGGKKKHKQKK